MTKKDFQLVANIISTIQPRQLRYIVAKQFAAKLPSTNKHFDHDRFMLACSGDQ